jgi:hypothetical protein
MVLSPELDTIVYSTGENCTHQTPLLCPVQVPNNFPSATDQTLIVLSCDPVANILSFDEIDIEFISLSCA